MKLITRNLILMTSLLCLSACSSGGGSSGGDSKAKSAPEIEIDMQDEAPAGTGESTKTRESTKTNGSAGIQKIPSAESAPATPDFPVNPESITVEINENGNRVFGEAVSIAFKRYGRFFSRNLYVFKKAYIGPVDDHPWFWQEDDDITLSTPWKTVSIDLETMKAYGGPNAGEGFYLGDVTYDGVKFHLEPKVDFVFNKKEKQISILARPTTPQLNTTSCPAVAKLAGQTVCDLYKGIYDTLSAIDFNALGEVGPGVSAEVLNFNTVFELAKSVAFFRPGVDQIRNKYLVPVLKSIHQLKALKTADQKHRARYLAETQTAYVNLIITTLDTVLKTQKMMPEALAGAGTTSLGVFLAYGGLNTAGDWVIGKGQPLWYKQIVSPIIREFGVVLLDILLNGTGTPMQQRIDRLIAMEEQIQDAISRICSSSKTLAESECSEAM